MVPTAAQVVESWAEPLLNEVRAICDLVRFAAFCFVRCLSASESPISAVRSETKAVRSFTKSIRSVMGITSHQMEGSARHEGCRQQGRFYQSG